MRRTLRPMAVSGCALLVGAGVVACTPSRSWHSELVVDDARNPVFSPDGTKVAFESYADLGSGDTNGRRDVFVHDLASGTTTLVSANADGTSGGNHNSFNPVFSPDGSKVLFDSYASDLGPTDTNGVVEDVYLRELASGATTLVSANADGSDSGNDTSFAPVFTPDGSRVGFTSRASNLVATDTNGAYDVFLHDLASGSTTLVSTNAGGSDSGDGASSGLRFGPDGATVSFTSRAGDLGFTDTNGADDVYLRDLTTGATSLVSVNADGSDSGNARSFAPVLAGDGSRLVFSSDASDLGPTDTNANRDVYVRDLVGGTTELVSVNAAGTDSGNALSVDPVLSPDGHEVAFATPASDLGPTDPGGGFDFDVYVRDLVGGTTELVSVNAAGTDGGNGYSVSPVFSPDGHSLAFESEANDLGPTDTNTCPLSSEPPGTPCSDIYVRDLTTGTTTLASVDDGGTDSRYRTISDGAAFNPVDSAQLAYRSWQVDSIESIRLSTFTTPG